MVRARSTVGLVASFRWARFVGGSGVVASAGGGDYGEAGAEDEQGDTGHHLGVDAGECDWAGCKLISGNVRRWSSDG